MVRDGLTQLARNNFLPRTEPHSGEPFAPNGAEARTRLLFLSKLCESDSPGNESLPPPRILVKEPAYRLQLRLPFGSIPRSTIKFSAATLPAR